MQSPDLRRFHEKYMMSITLTAMVLGLLFVYLSPAILVTIPSGHLGVRWYRFFKGTDLGPAVQEGTHLKFPWDELYDYDARAQLVDREFDAISKEGLLIKTHISFLFRVKRDTLGMLHKEVGPDYLNVILIPELGSIARSVISQYGAEEFYSTQRSEAREEILDAMRARLFENNAYSPNGVVLIEFDKVMLRSIILPERIATAIESKIEQYQRQLEYDFRLQVETKEKARKSIEGEGVRALFDNIGTKDLPSYLRLTGINATLELARSNNAKIIVTGSSLNALPLLIGNDTVTPPPPADKTSLTTQQFQTPKADAEKNVDKPSTAPKASPAKPETPPAKTEKPAVKTGKAPAN